MWIVCFLSFNFNWSFFLYRRIQVPTSQHSGSARNQWRRRFSLFDLQLHGERFPWGSAAQCNFFFNFFLYLISEFHFTLSSSSASSAFTTIFFTISASPHWGPLLLCPGNSILNILCLCSTISPQHTIKPSQHLTLRSTEHFTVSKHCSSGAWAAPCSLWWCYNAEVTFRCVQCHNDNKSLLFARF